MSANSKYINVVVIKFIDESISKQLFISSLQKETPWWMKVAGSFEHDPTFDEATRFGREWRKSAE